jgi:thiamine pyrophosphokinase
LALDYAKIIACDGALNWCQELNVQVDVVIGDGDSIDKPEQLTHHEPNQDTTDLQKALAYVQEHLPFAQVDIIGSWSEDRPDHSLASLQLLRDKQVTRIITHTSHMYLVTAGEQLQLPESTLPNTTVSFIPITATAEIELVGFAWSGIVTLSNEHSGISNIVKSSAKLAKLDVRSGEVVCCIL